MSIENNKQVKLSEVYNELTNIKSQLYSLTQPSNNQSNNSTLVKINIMQSGQSSPHNRPHNRSYEKYHDKINPKNYCYQRVPKMSNIAQKKALKSPENNTFRQNKSPNQTIQNHEDKYPKEGLGEYATRTAERLKKELKYIPKIQFSPPKNQTRTPDMGSPQKDILKKNLHIRHTSHHESLQKGGQTQKNPNYIKERYQPQRQMFTFKKNNETTQENNPKRLKRMRSDFTGYPHATVKEDIFKPISLSDKVKNLEEELKRKDQANKVLCAQLQLFERSFKELEQVLWTIIQTNSARTKKQDIDIVQALKEVFSDMELQNGQLARLHIQCQKWRKLNLQQEQKLLKLQQRLRNVGKSDESILKLKSDCEKHKHESSVLASKLQVAVQQNQLKDDFIVKLLSNKNHSQAGKSNQTMEMLQKYMSAFNYPNNRLLGKLTQESAQIERLKTIAHQKK